MNNKSRSERGDEQVGENWEYFLDPSYFDMWCVRNKAFTAFYQSLHLNNKDEAIGLFDLLEAKDDQLSHLQKLCEEQKAELEMLKKDASGKAICLTHDCRCCLDCEQALKSQLAEQGRELHDTKLLCTAEAITRTKLEFQLAEQKAELLAKDNRITELCSEGHSLNAELAEQTERVRRLEEALRPFCNPPKTSYGARIINESCYLKAQQALNQEESK